MPARIGGRGIAPRSGWMGLGSATGNFRWGCVKAGRAGVLPVITKAKKTNDTASQRHSKPTTQQANDTTNQLHSKPTTQQTNDTASQRHSKPTTQQTNDTANQRHSKPTTRQTNSTANQRLLGSMNPNRPLQIQKQLQRRLPTGGRYRVNVWVRPCNTCDEALVGLPSCEEFRSVVRGGVG